MLNHLTKIVTAFLIAFMVNGSPVMAGGNTTTANAGANAGASAVVEGSKSTYIGGFGGGANPCAEGFAVGVIGFGISHGTTRKSCVYEHEAALLEQYCGSGLTPPCVHLLRRMPQLADTLRVTGHLPSEAKPHQAKQVEGVTCERNAHGQVVRVRNASRVSHMSNEEAKQYCISLYGRPQQVVHQQVQRPHKPKPARRVEPKPQCVCSGSNHGLGRLP